MALETAFGRFALLPGFIQTGNGEPRKAHWLGNKQPAPQHQDTGQGGHDDRPQKRPDTRGYRDLGTITLGDIDEVYNCFKHQLIPAPAEGWVARNYFCYVPLRRRRDERPPVVLGRVKTIFPSDGYIENIEDMEMYFPVREGAPDLLHLIRYDFAPQRHAVSYCMGVKMYLSPEETADFGRSENIFVEQGFAPIYEQGYLDLLELNEHNQASAHWLHVIGSGWFASVPESVQPEVREKLRSLLRWGKTIFNYHPRRYALQCRSLNDELEFQYGFTEQYLVTPQDTGQVLRKIDERFGEIFMQGMF